jgi:hypothetical protein
MLDFAGGGNFLANLDAHGRRYLKTMSGYQFTPLLSGNFVDGIA